MEDLKEWRWSFKRLQAVYPPWKKSAGKNQRESVSDHGPTSEDGATALRLLSPWSSVDSLQRAAIISFQSAEEEGVLNRPHGGEEEQMIEMKKEGETKKKYPNPHRPPSSCSTGLKSKHRSAR